MHPHSISTAGGVGLLDKVGQNCTAANVARTERTGRLCCHPEWQSQLYSWLRSSPFVVYYSLIVSSVRMSHRSRPHIKAKHRRAKDWIYPQLRQCLPDWAVLWTLAGLGWTQTRKSCPCNTQRECVLGTKTSWWCRRRRLAKEEA